MDWIFSGWHDRRVCQTYRYAGKEDITLDFDSGAATLKFADGTQAILTRQTAPGDFDAAPFGIRLEDKPVEAPQAENEIVGDQDPNDVTHSDELFGSDDVLLWWKRVSVGEAAGNDGKWRVAA